MSVTPYPTLRLKLTMPTALKLQFLPAVPGFNASQVANKVDRAGDTMQGQLLLAADPTFPLEAATKQYVDAHGGAAPVDAEYITSTVNAALTNERVLTDTATVTWDRTVAGQIKANSAGGVGTVRYTASSTAPVSPVAGDLWYDLSTGMLSIYVNDGTSSQWVMVSPSGGGGSVGPPQGRLTLQTVTPVMTTTQAAKTTLFYSPYVGNLVPIYDGTSMVMTVFTELSVATTDTTKSPAAIGVSKVNDWFVWNDAGTIRLGHGPDWTSDTARSAGTALVMVNGIWLNNASITNGPAASRGTYVGTTRSNASSQLDWIVGAIASNGTAGFLGVWNTYNRVNVASSVGDSTDSWTLGAVSGAVQAANNSPTMRNSFVVGLAEDIVKSTYSALCTPPAGGGNAAIGIGNDVTNGFSGAKGFFALGGVTTQQSAQYAAFYIGFHFHSACETNGSTTTACNFYGDNGNPALYQNLLISELRM